MDAENSDFGEEIRKRLDEAKKGFKSSSDSSIIIQHLAAALVLTAAAVTSAAAAVPFQKTELNLYAACSCIFLILKKGNFR